MRLFFCLLFQTGLRPVSDPLEEPLTVVLNGLVDNRNFKVDDVDQYNQTAANINELIVNRTYTCQLSATGMVPRMGAAAGFAKGAVGGGFRTKKVVCGHTLAPFGIYRSEKLQSSDNSGRFLRAIQELNRELF